MRTLKKVFSIFNPHQQKKCFFIIFMMIIGAILEAIGIGAIVPLISVIEDYNFLNKHENIAKFVCFFGVYDHVDFIVFISIILFFLYLIKNVFLAWEIKLQIDFALTNQIEFSKMLLNEYLKKTYTYHINNNTANLLRNVNTAGLVIFTNIVVPVFMLLTEIITAITIGLMLALVDFFISIIVFGLVGVMIFLIVRKLKLKIKEYGEKQNIFSIEYLKWINQALGAVKETKVSCKEDYFIKKFSVSYSKYGNAYRKFYFISQVPRILIEFFVVSSMLLLIVVKILIDNRPIEIVPLLGVLSLAAFRLMPSVNRILVLSNGIRFQMPFFDEIYDDLIIIKNKQNNIKEVNLDTKITRMEFEKEIDIQEISFSYPETEKNILNNIKFIIPKGKFIGIVGSSGSGKTTFIDILLGLLTPSAGTISVDGKNIYDDIRAWQANLAYVPQSIYLIDGTIRENIAMGIDEEEIDNALITKVLHMADLYDFVQELPAGLNTTVGERGVKLSGGQRQRIGIARALYYQPQVLVLDEATSALDNDIEKSITDTILKLKGQITIIAVAHRLTTLAQCDFKVKFENGKAEIIN